MPLMTFPALAALAWATVGVWMLTLGGWTHRSTAPCNPPVSHRDFPKAC